MDERSKQELLKKIKRAAKFLRKDEQMISKTEELIDYCQQSSDVDIVLACCQALSVITKKSQALTNTEKTFREITLHLYSWLNHESDSVKVLALNNLVELLQFKMSESSEFSPDHHFKELTNHLLSSNQNQRLLIDALPDFEATWGDSSNEVMEKVLRQFKIVLNKTAESPSDQFLSNGWKLIKHLSGNDMDQKAMCLMTGVVCSFLGNQMPTKLYKFILNGIAPVMEKMSSPVRLTDFLTQSFDIGGAVSLMSLQGLFILMTNYNLDYPDFYGKLYSMCQPQIFAKLYGARYFELTQTFLSSTHLPAYIVAAFAKRFSRLALHAPSGSLHLIIKTIYILIKEHPSCEVLIHRGQGPMDFDSDPFMDDEDMSKCRALESCLWELQTLEHHYNPFVSQNAKKRHHEQNLMSMAMKTFETLEAECKKLKKEVPLNFEKPDTLDLPYPFIVSTD